MYHGPVTDNLLPGQSTDFILLEMRNGYPMLRVDHGSGLNNSACNAVAFCLTGQFSVATLGVG